MLSVSLGPNVISFSSAYCIVNYFIVSKTFFRLAGQKWLEKRDFRKVKVRMVNGKWLNGKCSV
jgi:hypothetical protein